MIQDTHPHGTADNTLNSLRAKLAAGGLNLLAILPMRDLPDEIKIPLVNVMPGRFLSGCLVLMGNGGGDFWSHYREQSIDDPDPVDRFSLETGERILRQQLSLKESDLQALYPGHHLVPLQQLGRLAGWHHPSPLGVGINHEWGLWYAYRAAFACTLELPRLTQPKSDNPCDSCREQPCVTRCPAQALDPQKGIDINQCAGLRLADNSPCADRCIGREACPVAPQARYSDEQIRYHYRQSLHTLKQYYAPAPSEGH